MKIKDIFTGDFKMRILHINSYYAGSLFYKNLYNKQREKALNIEVYLPMAENATIPKMDLGEYTKISKNHGKYDRAFFHFKHKKIYSDILEKYDIEKYDIIHAHSLFSNGYIAYKLYKKYNLPYIVAVRNTDINIFFKKMLHLRKLGVNILKNADKIVFISNTYKDYLIDEYIPRKDQKAIAYKSYVIANGIDDFWLENKFYKRKFIKDKKLNLLYVGLVDKNKNIETSIKACDMLIEEGFDIKYRIIGNIKDETRRGLIKSRDFIKHVDHSSKEKLLNYYRTSDVFVMPSHHETFGIVYIEAMSQGLPLIYTRGQGFDGQFKEGQVGYGVDPNSPEEIVKSIKDIIDNYNYISQKCLENVEKFSWDKIEKDYRDLYDSILK